jgi:hypothetical protein
MVMQDSLVNDLKHGTEEERFRAVCELGRRGTNDPAMILLLSELVDMHLSPRMDSAIATTLGKSGSPLAVAPLCTIIRRRYLSFTSARRAATALGTMGIVAVDSIPILVDAFRSHKTRTRHYARMATWNIGEACIKTGDGSVQLALVKALDGSRRHYLVQRLLQHLVLHAVNDHVKDAALVAYHRLDGQAR